MSKRKPVSAAPAPAGKSLAEFISAHDPRHVVEDVEERYDQPTPKGCKVFLFSSAQNATPLHPEFWAILRKIQEHRRGQLLVIPLRYKNVTSCWLGSQKNAEYWDVPREFRQNVRKQLNDNLVLLADVKTQPTAKDPLTGYDAMSGGFSAILGHTKLALKCIPTTGDKLARILTTTGACTVENYTDTKAGKIGSFHHSLSATLVELDGPLFHLRQLHYSAATRSVTDGARMTRYRVTSPEGARGVDITVEIEKAPPNLALVEGDKHVDYADPQVERCTQRMLAELDPDYSVVHDVLDAYSCNPHHWGNPMNAIAKRRAGTDDVRAEVQRAISFIRSRATLTRPSEPSTTRQVVVVDSNHNDMLSRWILRSDWKLDPTNAQFYLETALAMARDCRITGQGTEYVDPFLYWLERADIKGAKPSGESFVLAGVELALHGDKGPNGARGSIRNLRRIGVKTIVGHSHTPGIDEGCYQVGTSSRLRLEYNGGPSSWMHAHVLLQADGKRQLLFIIDGRYKA